MGKKTARLKMIEAVLDLEERISNLRESVDICSKCKETAGHWCDGCGKRFCDEHIITGEDVALCGSCLPDPDQE
jgi:predicted amidophosphoribosyltransferase